MKGRRGTVDGSTLVGAIDTNGNTTGLNLDGSGNLKTSATVTPAANQRVNAQAGDFVTGSIVDLTTLIANTADLLADGDNLATIAGALSSSTSTKTSVNAAVSDTSLLASNASRKGGVFFNDSTAILYLSYGSGAASTTSYTVQIPANGYYEFPSNAVPLMAIRGIWSAANGAVRITELS